MSQHDMDILNAANAAVRADLNLAIKALVSNNSGATEPATMFAYQWWPDTATGLLKQRNAANSAWVTIGTMALLNLGLAALNGNAANVFSVDAPTAEAHAVPLGSKLNSQLITASGSWTAPAGVTKAVISGVGGGGGGGGGSNGGGSGGGGGGGAKVVRKAVTVVPTTEYTVTIGGGGSGGGINADGGAGATSSFGALVSLAGGGGGSASAGGAHAGHAGEGNQSGQPGSVSNTSAGGLGGGLGGGQGGGSGGAGGSADANTGGGGGGGNSTGASSTGGAGGSGYFLVEW